MENKNKEHFTTDSIFPQVSELRASEVKITDHGRLQLVMKDEVSTRYTSCRVDGDGGGKIRFGLNVW